jgi:hypothetical protein
MDVLIGYTGGGAINGGIIGGSEESAPLDSARHTAALTAALAWPAAIPWPPSSAELPQAPGETGVLVFALPRKTASETSVPESALNKFLKGRQQKTGIVFIYNTDGRKAVEIKQEAARCANFYSGKSCVHAIGEIK